MMQEFDKERQTIVKTTQSQVGQEAASPCPACCIPGTMPCLLRLNALLAAACCVATSCLLRCHAPLAASPIPDCCNTMLCLRQVTDAQAEVEALRRLVKLKTRELKNIRRLAQEVLLQRSDVETFLLSSLHHVRGRRVLGGSWGRQGQGPRAKGPSIKGVAAAQQLTPCERERAGDGRGGGGGRGLRRSGVNGLAHKVLQRSGVETFLLFSLNDARGFRGWAWGWRCARVRSFGRL